MAPAATATTSQGFRFAAGRGASPPGNGFESTGRPDRACGVRSAPAPTAVSIAACCGKAAGVGRRAEPFGAGGAAVAPLVAGGPHAAGAANGAGPGGGAATAARATRDSVT